MDDSSTEERAEIARLRARVAELERERAQAAPTDTGSGTGRGRAGGGWRAAASAVLITVACVLAPLSIVSVWADAIVSDTDQYVETVAPVADDPGVQAALAAEVTTAVMENLDVDEVTEQALASIAEQPRVPPRVADALPGLAVPLTAGIESFTRTQTEALLASDAFAQVWAEVNRVSHAQVVSLLSGEQGGAVSAQDDTITLNLGPVIAAVKEQLVAAGFELAANIPEVDRSFVLVQSDAIPRAQRGYDLLETLGFWLPFIALALLVGGVMAARDRRRALLRGSLGVAVAVALLGIALIVVRILYVESTPAGILTPETAGNVFDTLVRFLRTSMRAVGVLALVVALAAFLSGPSSSAASARLALGRAVGSARNRSDAAGWGTGRFGTWVGRHTKALRVGVLAVAGLVLLSWDRPTVGVVVGVTLAALVALGLVELVARPATDAEQITAGTAGDAHPIEPAGSKYVPAQGPPPQEPAGTAAGSPARGEAAPPPQP